MTKITLQQDTTIKKTWRGIGIESWDKVKIRGKIADKNSLNKTNFFNTMVLNPNPKFIVRDRWLGGFEIFSFASDEVVKDVKKVFPNAEGYIMSRNTLKPSPGTVNPGNLKEGEGFLPNFLFSGLLSNSFEDPFRGRGNHLFINYSTGQYNTICKIRSWEVFKFLQTYSNDNTFDVIYPAGMWVEASEVGLPEPVINNPTPPAPQPQPQPQLPQTPVLTPQPPSVPGPTPPRPGTTKPGIPLGKEGDMGRSIKIENQKLEQQEEQVAQIVEKKGQ